MTRCLAQKRVNRSFLLANDKSSVTTADGAATTTSAYAPVPPVPLEATKHHPSTGHAETL